VQRGNPIEGLPHSGAGHESRIWSVVEHDDDAIYALRSTSSISSFG
jgi:hypothetical protein